MSPFSLEVIGYLQEIKSNPDLFHKAHLLEILTKEKDIPLTVISREINLKPSFICHILRLNRLPDIIKDGYYAKLLTMSHLFIISRIKKQALVLRLYEEILKESLTVTQTEVLVREALYNVKAEGTYIFKQELDELLKELNTQTMSTRVVQTQVKSKVVIELKGNLTYTSPQLLDLIEYLKSWKKRVKKIQS